MSEELIINEEAGKSEKYVSLIPQLESLLAGERNLIANFSNTAAALFQMFRFQWVGFYIVEDEELVVGPFQGPIACNRIPLGKGVCGASWAKDLLINVPDVNQFPGHIACSHFTQSEIVMPVHDASGKVIAVLDIDSENLSDFDSTDEKYLQTIVRIIERNITLA